MKKVIITGANGFLGAMLIERLVKENIQVVAIDQSFENQAFHENLLIAKYEMDLDDIATLDSDLFVDVDHFYHLAWKGVNGAKKGDPLTQVNNIQLTIKCADFAKKIDVEKFLCAGTIAERAVESLENLEQTSKGMMYGTAKFCTKTILETYCKNIGLDYVWMQFSNIYGPTNKTGNLINYTITELMSDKKASFGPANQPYDFVYVDDLIEAVYRLGASQSAKGFYYIGSGNPKILKEYLFKIGEILDKKSSICIGERADDGIRYSFDMFDITHLVQDIGEYITKPFGEHIEFTINKIMEQV